MDLKQGFSKQITKLNMKTSSFLEETKVKTYIGTLQSEIQELKVQAGELGYDAYVNGQDVSAQLKEIYDGITIRYQTIRQQEELLQQQAMRNKQVLGGMQAQAAAEAAIFCPNCGERYATAVKFCRKCGTKLQ